MPWASLFTLHVYGEAAGAAVVTAAGSGTGTASGLASGAGSALGVGTVVTADATRLVNRPATITGTGSVVTASPRARARALATIRVNAITQDDVTGAVLDIPLDGALTVRQAMRVMLAALAGKASGAPGGPIVFRDVGDTKARITATVDGSGNRTTVTVDGA